jgi:hypothetical protein
MTRYDDLLARAKQPAASKTTTRMLMEANLIRRMPGEDS